MNRRLLAIVAALSIFGLMFAGSGVQKRHMRPSLSALLTGSKGISHPESMTEGERAAQFLADREGQVDPERAVAAKLEAQREAQRIGFAPLSASTRWRELGPKPYRGDDTTYNDPYNGAPPTGFTVVSGRVSAIVVDPNDASGNTVWVGTAGGGLWITRNGGDTFKPVWDSKPSAAIGAIAFDQTHPRIMYVGTGDGSAGSSASARGDGVYRSTNDGKTFNRVARNVNAALVTKIVARAGHIYVGTNRGVFVSSDGGTSYQNSPLPTSQDGTSVGTALLSNIISDIGVHPDRPNEVTVAVGCIRGHAAGCMGNGLYRSDSYGAPGSWTRLDVSGLTLGSLSDDPIGRISFTYATGATESHDVIWAVVQDPGMVNGKMKHDVPRKIPTQLNGIYRSSDDGAHWTLKGNAASLLAAPGSGLVGQAALYTPGIQSSYNQWIAISPINPAIVDVGLEEIYQTSQNADSATGPAAWTTIGRYWDMCAYPVNYTCGPVDAGPYSGQITPHGDQHAYAFGNGGTTLWVGNDGGVMKQSASDGVFSNNGWKPFNDTLGTTQAYYSAMGSDGTVYAGFQDNGIGKITPDGKGIDTFVGDGGDVAIDPQNSDNAWGEYVFGTMFKTTDGGRNWIDVAPDVTGSQFIAPFVMDPNDSNHLVLGTSSIIETTKGTATVCTQEFLVTGTHLPNDANCDWINSYDLGVDSQGFRRTATAITAHGATAYAGFCGLCGINVRSPDSDRKIRNGIATNYKPGCDAAIGTSTCWHIASAKGLPNRFITALASPEGLPNVVIATESGYAQPWIAPTSRTPNIGHGHVFISIDGAEHFRDISGNLPNTPVRSLVLAAGTAFVGTDSGVYVQQGSAWKRFGIGLPNVAVDDLKTNPQGTQIVAATYGRGVWAVKLPARFAGIIKVVQAQIAGHKPSSAVPVLESAFAEGARVYAASRRDASSRGRVAGLAAAILTGVMFAFGLRLRRAFR